MTKPNSRALPAARTWAAVVAAATLLGCAAPGTVAPQQASMDQVRDRVGLPTDIRFAANGDELWEFATGPGGTQTYLMRMGKDGRVQEVTQLLTPERFRLVEVGRTTKAQIRDLFGRPSDLRRFRSGLVWEWRAQFGPELGHYAVRFDDSGIVREKMMLTDPQTDDGKDSQ